MHIVLGSRILTIFTILSMFRVIFHTFCNHEISVKAKFCETYTAGSTTARKVIIILQSFDFQLEFESVKSNL